MEQQAARGARELDVEAGEPDGERRRRRRRHDQPAVPVDQRDDLAQHREQLGLGEAVGVGEELGVGEAVGVVDADGEVVVSAP